MAGSTGFEPVAPRIRSDGLANRYHKPLDQLPIIDTLDFAYAVDLRLTPTNLPPYSATEEISLSIGERPLYFLPRIYTTPVTVAGIHTNL